MTSEEKHHIEWIPMLRKNRSYDTEANVQPVGRCDRCGIMLQNRRLTEYPRISQRAPRRVCDSCLIIDKQTGLFDAIMDIWNNYEEHEGIGHRLTINEILEMMNNDQ